MTTLATTLASVEACKSQEVEYIAIDGASSDGTLDLLKDASVVDKLVSEPDVGIYDAMNKGVALASGHYAIFINGDDELMPVGFRSIVESLGVDSADIISGTSYVGSIETPDEELIAQPWKLAFFNSIPHPSTFVRTSVLKRFPFDTALRIAGDYDFFLRAHLAGCSFDRIAMPVALHHRGGASGNAELSAREVDLIRKRHLGWRYHAANAILGSWRLAAPIRRRLRGGR